jgi:HEPN domain-containing protein
VNRQLGSPDNHFRFNVWLAQADHDLAAAKLSLDRGYYEWACFQAEQSTEKALKSAIVYHGKSAPKLHKLGVLIGIIKSIDPRFRGIHLDIAELQSYTFTARYPFLIPGNYETPHDYINREDAEICIHQAQTILNLIREVLGV